MGNYRIALGYLGERDKLPIADDTGGLAYRLVEARTLMHVDREADAADAADKALAVVERTPSLFGLRPLVVDRDALYHLATGSFDRALALYDLLLPLVHGGRNATVARLARAGAALGAGQARRAVADLDAVDAGLRDAALAPSLRWPHTSAATTLRSYRLIAAGLRANADLRLGELDAAAQALERRRALAVERLEATGLDEHLRSLGLVEARLVDVERDRHDWVAANRWLGLALDHADAYQRRTGVQLRTDQLDLLRLASELRLDHRLTLKLDLPHRLAVTVDRLLAEHDPDLRTDLRWIEIYAAALAPR